jgi:long-chain acyl-CoA synthetase
LDLAAEPARPAFVRRTAYRAFRWSAGEVVGAACDVVERLDRFGVEPGDRVILRGANSPEWCAVFLGILARGAIVVPLDEGAPDDFCRRVAGRVEPRVAFVESSALGETGVAHAVALDTIEPLPPPGALPDLHPASPDDTAEIVFTSGTTAEPRGVELTHANLLAVLERIEGGFRKREWFLKPLLPMRFLCLVPMSHMFGQSLGLFIPIVMRSTSIFASSLLPARLIRTVREERPLAVIAVPRTLAALREAVVRELERRGRDERLRRGLARSSGRRAWRRILATRDLRAVLGWRTWALVAGGAALDAEVEAFWSGCGFAVIQGYGMTEAAPIIAVHNPLDGTLHSIGRPMGGVEVRVAEDGEVWVRGPNVMKGYWGEPEATRDAVADGWLRTGDLAERDETGRLYYRGRKKDLIVTPSGVNVHPEEVERLLAAHGHVREAVVFALPGDDGDEVHAAILTDIDGVDPAHLRSRVNSELPSHQRLKGIVVWPRSDFPRTATGKVRRGEVAVTVRTLRGRGVAAAPSAGVTRAARALEQVRSDLAAGVDPRARLTDDLGLDSLEVLEVLSLIEEEYGVSVDDRRAGAAITVGDLDTLVAPGSRGALRVAMPRWGRRAIVAWFRTVLRNVVVLPAFHLFVRLEVSSRPDPGEGPLLLVANHTSTFDVPAILAGLPGPLRRRLAVAMAIETLPEHFRPEGRPWSGRLRSAVLYNLAVLLFNAYPLPQSHGFRPSLEYTGELLDSGFAPLVFPEGRMTPTGEMEAFKAGIGLLALETRARVLPVFLEGLREILPPGGRRPRSGRARMIVGDPFDPLEAGPRDPGEIAARIERAVRRLGERS